MGDRQNIAAGLRLVISHPSPQVARIGATQRLCSGIGLDLPGYVAAIAIDDIAVQIVAGDERRPLVADDRGEATGVVCRFRRLDDPLPGGSVGGGARQVLHRFGKASRAEGNDHFAESFRNFARFDQVVPAAGCRIGQNLRLSGKEIRRKTHIVGMVRDDQEIQRTGELDRLAGGADDLLSPGETVGVLRPDRGARHARVHGQGCVEMGIAEQRARRKVSTRIGRIRRLCRE